MPKIPEIITLSPTEVKIGENRIYFLEKDLIYIEAIGDQTKEIAQLTLDFFYSLTPPEGVMVNHLINLNRSGKNSPEARKAWRQISESDTVRKVAAYGFHPVARILASFVIEVTNKMDIRFFKSHQKALNWIRS